MSDTVSEDYLKKKKILETLEYLEANINEESGLSEDEARELLFAIHCLKDFSSNILVDKVQDTVETKTTTKVKKITANDLILPTEVKEMGAFSVYSDGGCRGNPGPGAYGTVGQSPSGELIFTKSEFFADTTNNRMELLGATKGLELMIRHLADLKMAQTTPVILYTDSRYVVDGLEKWLPNWKARNWRKADNKEPENIDLWKNFDFISSKFKNLNIRWVKGHSGHPQNEMCDQLANESMDSNKY